MRLPSGDADAAGLARRRGRRRTGARRRLRAAGLGRPGAHGAGWPSTCGTRGSSRTTAPEASTTDVAVTAAMSSRVRRRGAPHGGARACAGPTTGGASGTSPRPRLTGSAARRHPSGGGREVGVRRDEAVRVQDARGPRGWSPSTSDEKSPSTVAQRERRDRHDGRAVQRLRQRAHDLGVAVRRGHQVDRPVDGGGQQVLDRPDLVGERDPRPELPTVAEPAADAELDAAAAGARARRRAS